MKRKRKRRRNSSPKLSFESLEPRQLLAGDVIGSHQASGFVPTGSNLVVNGDFENLGADTDNFYSDSDVAGWFAEDSASGQEINIFDYGLGFDNVLDLDSTGFQFDQVFQDINTTQDESYVIAFDYSIHPSTEPDAAADTNTFQVWWDGALQDEFTGDSYWQTGVISVTGGDAESTRLLFSEIGADGGDGRGALLDNIRVVKVNEIDVPNGSFEINSDESDLFYRPNQVDNWSAINANVNDRFLKIVEQDQTLATDGTQYLNLDATENTRDIIFTDLETTAGQSYYVTFDLRIDGSAPDVTDQLRIRWNTPLTAAGDASQWAGTVIGNHEWSTYGLALTAEAAQTRLLFLEPGGTTGDGSGPLIDNVRIFEIETSDLVVDGNGSQAEGTTASESFIPNLGAQRIAESVELSHPENSGTFTSATITLGGIQDGNREIVAISDSVIPLDANGDPKIANLRYNNSTNQLVLTGEATAAEYQQVIRSLTYFNTSDVVTVADRTISVFVEDTTLPAETASASADIVLSVETDQALIDDTVIQKYLADNNIVAETHTTVDGLGPLYYVVNDPGSGLNPTFNDTVRVSYVGNSIEVNSQNRLVTGAVFDRNDNAQFPLSGVIRGWSEGVPLIRNGGSITLIIPSALAYGPEGQISNGGAFANEILLFDIDLLQII